VDRRTTGGPHRRGQGPSRRSHGLVGRSVPATGASPALCGGRRRRCRADIRSGCLSLGDIAAVWTGQDNRPACDRSHLLQAAGGCRNKWSRPISPV